MAALKPTDLEHCVENIEQAFKEYFIPSPDEKDRNDLLFATEMLSDILLQKY